MNPGADCSPEEEVASIETVSCRCFLLEERQKFVSCKLSAAPGEDDVCFI